MKLPEQAGMPVSPSPLAPDWRPHRDAIAALERELGVKLAPRSQVATDGLVLRSASAPARCDDATLARLAPVAAFIVEAQLARTQISDAGLAALATWGNLRSLDLTRTAVTSGGLAELTKLPKIETINLTDTAVDDTGLVKLKGGAVPATTLGIWDEGDGRERGSVAERLVDRALRSDLSGVRS